MVVIESFRMNVLVITPPKCASFDEVITHKIDKWIINLVDRDALVCCTIFEKYYGRCVYLPLNLLFPYFCGGEKDINEITNKIIGFNFDLIVFIISYLNEGTMFFSVMEIMKQCNNLEIKNENAIILGNYPSYEKGKLLHSGYKFIGTTNDFYEHISKKEHVNINSSSYVPAYEKILPYLDVITYHSTGKLNLGLRTSFGCPYKCIFCSTSSTHKIMEYIDPKVLCEEIIKIDKLFDLKNIHFDCILDDEFGLDLNRFDLYVSILKKYKIKVDYVLMRADTVLNLKNKMDELKDITNYILIGVENCEDSILNIANKEQTFEEVLKAIFLLKNSGIKTHLNWIIGLPGESNKSLYTNIKTMTFLLRTGLADEIEPQLLVPFPWTTLFRKKDEYKMNLITENPLMFNEKGIDCIFSYENLTNYTLEKWYLLALYLCSTIGRERWDKIRLKKVLDCGSGLFLKKIKESYDYSDYSALEKIFEEK